MYAVIVMLFMIVDMPLSQAILEDPPAFAGIGFQPLPQKCKIEIELHTAIDNLYRVSFNVEGKTKLEVNEAVVKELKRHHWNVEAKASGLLVVRGYIPEDGVLERIQGITITLHACKPLESPLLPAISSVRGIRCKVLLVHQEPNAETPNKP